MHVYPVELPPGDAIRPNELAMAIVKALHPEKTEGLAGIACIVGKLVAVTAPRPSMNHALGFEPGRDLYANGVPFQLVEGTAPPPQSNSQAPLPLEKPRYPQDFLTEVVEDSSSLHFSLPYDLTEEDRKQLEPLLSALPPVTYPMTDGAISRFLDAYQGLPQRPSWVPLIITWDTIKRRLEKQSHAFEEHMHAIREEIEAGRLSACDGSRVPTRVLCFETLIPRRSAVEYLQRCGLSAREELHPAVNADGGKHVGGDGVYTPSGRRVWNKKETDETWTDEELEAVKAKLDTIDPETAKKYTHRRVADLLGLKSPGRITHLLDDLKDRRKKSTTPWAFSMNELNKKR
jgi:hypothetical protein